MIDVIITAGGSSTRFQGKNKLLFEINKKPVIVYSVDLFASFDFVREIIISSNKSIIPGLNELFKNYKNIKIVEGGDSRQQSVLNALEYCKNPDYVIIHDGARPFVTKDIVTKCLDKAKETNGAIAAVKSIDTIKIVDGSGKILSTPERSTLWNAQTPQVFKYDLIYKLHKKYKGKNFTDDALLFEMEGLPVFVVESDYSNYKITTLKDVKL